MHHPLCFGASAEISPFYPIYLTSLPNSGSPTLWILANRGPESYSSHCSKKPRQHIHLQWPLRNALQYRLYPRHIQWLSSIKRGVALFPPPFFFPLFFTRKLKPYLTWYVCFIFTCSVAKKLASFYCTLFLTEMSFNKLYPTKFTLLKYTIQFF